MTNDNATTALLDAFMDNWGRMRDEQTRIVPLLDAVRDARTRAATALNSDDYNAQKAALGAYFRALAAWLADDASAQMMPDFCEREAERFIWALGDARPVTPRWPWLRLFDALLPRERIMCERCLRDRPYHATVWIPEGGHYEVCKRCLRPDDLTSCADAFAVQVNRMHERMGLPIAFPDVEERAADGR